MANFQTILSQFIRDDNGATAIEYGLIAAMIAVGLITAMTTFGNSLWGMFNYIEENAGSAMEDAGG